MHLISEFKEVFDFYLIGKFKKQDIQGFELVVSFICMVRIKAHIFRNNFLLPHHYHLLPFQP